MLSHPTQAFIISFSLRSRASVGAGGLEQRSPFGRASWSAHRVGPVTLLASLESRSWLGGGWREPAASARPKAPRIAGIADLGSLDPPRAKRAMT
jgi:hypothetical protein